MEFYDLLGGILNIFSHRERKKGVRGRIHDVLERRKDGEQLRRDKLKVAVSQVVHEVDKGYVSKE